MRTHEVSELEQSLRAAWPLAVVLSGSQAGAVELLGRVACRRGIIGGRDPGRVLRLAVLAGRETHGPASRPPAPGTPKSLAVLDRLTGQHREAWVLTHVLGCDGIAMSRAMDCSRTAAGRFLSQAEQTVGDQLDAAAVGRLRAWAGAMDDDQMGEVLAAVHGWRRRVRLWRWVWVLVGVGAVLIAVTLAGR